MYNKKRIEKAIKEFKNGKMVIVVDREDRENEGDFIIAADKATPDDINFMMKFGRGLVCITIDQECSKRLDLSLMVQDNTSLHNTNFTVSVDAVKNVSTGIYYTEPLHLQPCFQYLDYKKGDFPECELACSEVLSLPIFPGLKVEEQSYVVGKIEEFYRKRK